MFIYSVLVMLLWVFSLIGLLFCLKAVKWLDDVVHEEGGVGAPAMGMFMGGAGVLLEFQMTFFPHWANDAGPYWFGFLASSISLLIYVGFWIGYCLVPFHRNLRKRKNY